VGSCARVGHTSHVSLRVIRNARIVILEYFVLHPYATRSPCSLNCTLLGAGWVSVGMMAVVSVANTLVAVGVGIIVIIRAVSIVV